jgi:alpha-glucoside transport system substrate-binding protein
LPVLRKTFGRLVSLALLLGLLAACTPTAINTGPGGKHLHVVGPWVGDEQASFMAMVKPWESQTGNKVDYEASRDLNALLTARVRAGTAPDLAALSSPGQMAELANNGTLLPLDKVVELNRLNADYGKQWLRLATVNGKLVAIVIKVAIEGLIFYDPKTLSAAGQDFGKAPPTWTAMTAAAQQIQAATHAAAWCIGVESGAASGWPGADWIRDFYLRLAGPAAYERWAAGKEPWTSPEMKAAWQSFGAIVHSPTLTYGGIPYVLSTNFATAFRPMFQSPPGCYLSHESSFLTDDFKNLQPVPDVNAVGFPDIDPRYGGAQVVAADLLGMLKDSPEARDLLRYLTSAQAQEIWVRRGGMLSANKQVGVDAYPDPVLGQAARLVLGANPPEFDLVDGLGLDQQAAFFKGVVRYISQADQLDAILTELEKRRKGGN